MRGALLLDKPPGITSARAVAKVKRLLPKGTKIGHTGTLDPLASGLLVLLLGRATRLSRYVTHLDKSYVATARFGAVSDTLDAEGEITPLDAPVPDERAIRAALPTFTGRVLQIPPMASAVKMGGERLYAIHRRGETVKREPRPVEINAFDLLELHPAEGTATFAVSCGGGTYVRTLVADLATHLGTGAYLTALRRTRVGHLTVKDAPTPDHLVQDTLNNHIIQMREVVAHLPSLEVSEGGERAVRNGRGIPAPGMVGSFRVERGGELLAVYGGDGEAAMAEVVLCGP